MSPAIKRYAVAAAAGAGVVALVTFGIVLARGRPWSGLPAVPDLAGRPEILAAEVREADAATRAWFAPRINVVELGGLYHVNGYIREAAVCWEFLSHEQVGEGRWPYYLADLARITGDEERMVAHLEEALRREPDYAPALLRRADNAFKRSRFDEADADYRRRLALVPGDPYARFGIARLHLQQGRRDDGKRALADLVRDVPDFPSALDVYAGLLAEDGDETGAARHRLRAAGHRFREAADPWLLELRRYCFDVDQLLHWAAQEALTSRPAEARAYFERAIAADPAEPASYADFGQFLLTRGETDEALAVLERGRERAPFDATVHLRSSMALRRSGQGEAAVALDRRGLSAAPDSYEFWDSLGQSLTVLGRFAEAEQAVLEARRLSPNAIVPQISLGMLYARSGRRAEARRVWEAAHASNPGDHRLLQVLGSTALEEGRLEDALRLIPPFFRHDPRNHQARLAFVELHLKLALAAVAAQDPAAAERWCTAGLDEAPDATELLGLLGTIHMQNGDVARALEAMEAHQRLLPGDPRAVMPLATLYRNLDRPADARRVLTEARDWLRANGGDEFVGQIEKMLQMLPRK